MSCPLLTLSPPIISPPALLLRRYGASPRLLSEKLKVPYQSAEKLIARFDEAFPGVAIWKRDAIDKADRNGYVMTKFNRCRFLPKLTRMFAAEEAAKEGRRGRKRRSLRGMRAKAERQVPNTICQGTAADFIKQAMVSIERHLAREEQREEEGGHSAPHGMRLAMQIHDELIYEVPIASARDAARLIRAKMETVQELTVPLPVHVKIGRRWGTLVDEAEWRAHAQREQRREGRR